MRIPVIFSWLCKISESIFKSTAWRSDKIIVLRRYVYSGKYTLLVTSTQ